MAKFEKQLFARPLTHEPLLLILHDDWTRSVPRRCASSRRDEGRRFIRSVVDSSGSGGADLAEGLVAEVRQDLTGGMRRPRLGARGGLGGGARDGAISPQARPLGPTEESA